MAHPWSTADVDVVTAGELVLPTGSIVACDPLVFLERARPFGLVVAPGTYRVIVAVRDGDVVYAAVVLRDGAPASWTPAGPEYPVDSGTGCFVDAAIAAAWSAVEASWTAENVQHVKASGVDPRDADAWHAAFRARDAERPDLHARLQAAGYGRRAYASLSIDAGTLVAFRTGAGDGVYRSHWGLDESGEPMMLLTDFGLLDDDPEPDGEETEEQPAAPAGSPLVRAATAILDRLLREELVVLGRRCKREALLDDLADALATSIDLGEWLADRADIDEVFATDEDLERIAREVTRTS